LGARELTTHPTIGVLALCCAVAAACGGGSREPALQPSSGPGIGDGTSGAQAEASSSSDAGGESRTDATDDGVDTAPMGPKLDVGADGGTGDGCPADDVCCVPDGELPPHALLDRFAAQYPPATIPGSVDALLAFAPAIEDLAMAWSDENVGGELVDPANGGVSEANLSAGRLIAHDTALTALPVGAVVVDTRDDPPLIVELGGPAPCNGVGWAWGSILYEATDLSIGELVYLYIGFCADPFAENDFDDLEVFYYSDQAVQICAAPG
jgi:hypothetical protein